MALPNREQVPGQSRAGSALANALRALADSVFRLVQKAKDDGKIVFRHRSYFLRPNFKLFYTVDPAIMNFETEQIEEEIWDYKSVAEFVDVEVKRLQEFQVVESIIGEDVRAKQLLGNFALTVARDSISMTASDVLYRHVETLLRDFDQELPKSRTKIWLTGLTLMADSIPVSDALSLRRPSRHDLQERVDADSIHYAHALQPHTRFSCIAEQKLPGMYPVYRQASVERLTTALRLFRVGAVANSMYSFEAESFDPLEHVMIGGPSRAGREVYKLSTSDAPVLSKFLEVMLPLIPTQIEPPQPRRDYISTALHWYDEALLASIPPEGTVASAIACLEALFLENVEMEMSYRLSVRVAGFIRCLGFPPLEVQATVKQAYGVRSKYVHGDEQDKKWSAEKLINLSKIVLEYSRASLVAFCQLRGKISRKDLLALVDSSLLHDESHAKLYSLCEPGVFCPLPPTKDASQVG